MNYIEKVREFHEAFNIPVGNKKRLTEERHDLRMSLIREELRELTQAKDDVEKLDGVCDLIYVLSGYRVEMGFLDEDIILLIPASELNGLSTLGIYADIGEIEWLYDEESKPRVIDSEIESAIGDVIDYATTKLVGFTQNLIQDAFLAVHESNMAKLWTKTDIQLHNKGAAYVGKYRFIESKTPGKFIAYRKDGKVMKPPTWQAPDLKSIIERYEAS